MLVEFATGSGLEQTRSTPGTACGRGDAVKSAICPAINAADRAKPAPIRNALLNALPADDLASLAPLLERVDLKRRQVLQERNVPLSYAYFIERGIASLTLRTGGSCAAALEVATLGNKDFAGVPLILGTARGPHRCIVQVSGEALRISADDLRQAMRQLPSLQRVLLGYVQASMVQSATIAVCTARHSLHERLARWMLHADDRLAGNEITLTHQALARALGVRRAGVTTAIGRMEDAGLVRRGRGRMTLVNREGLEQEACDCYRTMRAEDHRVCGEFSTSHGAHQAVRPSSTRAGIAGPAATRRAIPSVPASFDGVPARALFESSLGQT